MIKAGIILVSAAAAAWWLNRAWRRLIGRAPVDPEAPGDLEELVGNAGGLFIYIVAAALTLAAVWLLR